MRATLENKSNTALNYGWIPNATMLQTAKGIETPFGVFILANDRVYDFFRVVYNSVKLYSRGARVCIIPYDDQHSRIASLLQASDMVISDQELLDRCDAIGRTFLPKCSHQWRMFRKLAAFHGPFERFLYLDADIALLSNPEDLDHLLQSSELDMIGFDVNHEQVYKPGPFREMRKNDFGSIAITAGAWVAKRKSLSVEMAESTIPIAMQNHDEFELGVFDQAFFNFLLEEGRVNALPIFKLGSQYPHQTWSDSGSIVLDRDGRWIRRNIAHRDHGKAVPFIHWAGHSQHKLFPNRHIFRKLLYINEPRWFHLAFLLFDVTRASANWIFYSCWSGWRLIRRKAISFWINRIKKRFSKSQNKPGCESSS